RPVGIAPDVTQQLASISYSPFADSSHPDRGVRPTAEQIRSDLRTIAPYTRAIRTYSATGGAELVPPIAAEFGLKVTVGAWIDKPELASAVDFIAAHILPYWEGFDASRAVDHTIEFYDRLRKMHPGKRIVIAEFGWPSAGYNFHDAEPGRMEQAQVLRDFV